MIIKKMRASFGKLHETLELHGGMNLLCLPNEAGKSTWSAFLLAMLYGIDTSERASVQNHGLPAKERYKPWDGSAMEGAVELEWNGKNITIERTTDRRVPMGAFRAYETESGVPVPELTGENCGLVLCGVERSVFERTAFIRQSGMFVGADTALEKRLGALVTTGEEGAKSYSELEKALRERKNRLTGRAGKLPRLTQEAETLRRELQEIYAMQEQAMALTAKKEAAEEAVKTAGQRLKRLEGAREAQKQAGLAELEQRLSEQEQLCARLEQTVARLPGEEDLHRLQRRLEQAENDLNTAKMEAAFAPSETAGVTAPPYFAGLDGRQARERAAADCEEYERLRNAQTPKKTLPVLSGAALALGAGLAVCGWLWTLPVLLTVGAVLAAAGVLSLLICLPVLRKRSLAAQERRRQAELIPLRYGVTDCAELPRLAEEYDKALQEDRRCRDDIAAHKTVLQEAVRELEKRLNALISEVSAFAPDCASAADCREALAAALRAHSHFSAERRALDTLRQQRESLRLILGDGASAPEDPEALTWDEAKLRYEHRTAVQTLEGCTTRLAAMEGAISAKGDAVALTAALERCSEAITAAREQSEAIDLAMAALKSADETLRSRFSPQITAEAGELLAQLTGGKYPRVLLEPDMRLSVRAEDGTVMRAAAAMSCGTADQMYLALRLAMVRRLLPQDAPLVLDDALVNFDDERARSAVELLTREAENRQVILFTCHEFNNIGKVESQ